MPSTPRDQATVTVLSREPFRISACRHAGKKNAIQAKDCQQLHGLAKSANMFPPSEKHTVMGFTTRVKQGGGGKATGTKPTSRESRSRTSRSLVRWNSKVDPAHFPSRASWGHRRYVDMYWSTELTGKWRGEIFNYCSALVQTGYGWKLNKLGRQIPWNFYQSKFIHCWKHHSALRDRRNI